MSFIKTSASAAALALALGVASFFPAPAQAQSLVDVARVIVDAHDIVYRSGVPYYRQGSYRPQDRIIIVNEGGHRRYYRNVPRGNAYGYYKNGRARKHWNQRHDYRHDDRRDDRYHGRGH